MATIQTSDVTNLQLSKTNHKCSILKPLSNLCLRMIYLSLVHVSRGSEEISEGLSQHYLKAGFQRALHIGFCNARDIMPPTCSLPQECSTVLTLAPQKES